jgi:hypothetical protein
MSHEGHPTDTPGGSAPDTPTVMDRLRHTWDDMRGSPKRLAFVAGTAAAAILVGAVIGASILGNRTPSGADPSGGAAVGPTSTLLAATAEPTAGDSAGGLASATASATPAASDGTPAASDGTPEASASAEPGQGEPSPAPGEPSPTMTATIDWQTLPAMPYGRRGKIADVVELQSGEIAVAIWSQGDALIVYDPAAESWRGGPVVSEPVSEPGKPPWGFGTNSELAVMSNGDVLAPATCCDFDSKLWMWQLEDHGEEWRAIDLGTVAGPFQFLDGGTGFSTIDDLLYLTERSYRKTRFVAYDPRTGEVARGSDVHGSLEGTFTDGRYLYADDWERSRVLRFDPVADSWSAFAPAPPFGEPDYRLGTATGTGRLWVPAYTVDGYVLWAWSPELDEWQLVDIPVDPFERVHVLADSEGGLYVIRPSLWLYTDAPPDF